MLSLERFRFMPMDGEVVFKHFHDNSRHIVWTVYESKGFDYYEVTAHLGRANVTVAISTSTSTSTSNPEELDQVWSRLLTMQRKLLSSAELVVYADGSATWR